MRKLRALIGMPVVCRNRRIGRLLNAELDDALTRLTGIWVGAGIRGTRFISAESLEILGRVAILADDAGARRRMTAVPIFHRAISTDGQRLGAITGAEIDELSFNVTSLELSMGLWDDLLLKRQRVERYSVNPASGEVIIDFDPVAKEDADDEGRYDQGTDRRHADRRRSRDGFRRDELADGAQVVSEGQNDRQLDRRQGR